MKMCKREKTIYRTGGTKKAEVEKPDMVGYLWREKDAHYFHCDEIQVIEREHWKFNKVVFIGFRCISWMRRDINVIWVLGKLSQQV